MPPRIKVAKEDIVNAALDIVRKNGVQAINARTVAASLICSTQPVFSNFATMEDLHLAVIQKAELLYQDYARQEIESGAFPLYKANGMAYIRFAKEEKELFKLLYMCDRTGEAIPEDNDLLHSMETIVRHNTGLDDPSSKLFHLEMWAYVHGIATMFATGFLDLEWELVSRMLTDSYQGLTKYFKAEQ